MVFDRIGNWRQYFEGPVWECAFAYLSEISADAEEGDTPLQGDEIFSRVMSYPTRTPEEAKIEAHLNYIDIQMALENAEGINWYPTPDLEVKVPYDREKDRTLYQLPPQAPARVDVHPHTFAVLFPEDAHMPQLIVGSESKIVKKVVVKVKVDLVLPRAQPHT